MSDNENKVNLTTADLFHAEIARLQAEIELLRSQPCPYVVGTTTKYCVLTAPTLTDAEREAVEFFARLEVGANCNVQHANTLRGLLERCSQFAKRESDRPQPIATPSPLSTPAEGSVPTERT